MRKNINYNYPTAIYSQKHLVWGFVMDFGHVGKMLDEVNIFI
jgi:hypothetical protein